MRQQKYIDALESVRQEPHAFLERETLSCLKAHMSRLLRGGAILATESEDLAQLHLAVFPIVFGDWVARRMGLTKKLRSGRWDFLTADHWTIVRMVVDDDALAYREFFRLLDQFKSLTTRRIARVEITADDGRSPMTQAHERRLTGLHAIQLFPERGCYLFEQIDAPQSSLQLEPGSYFESMRCLFDAARSRYGVSQDKWILSEYCNRGIFGFLRGIFPSR
jgi:hypothetical protein